MIYSRIFILFLLFSPFVSCSQGHTIKTEVQFDLTKLKTLENHPVIFYNVENLFDTIDSKGINDFEFTPLGDKNWDTERYNAKLKKLAEVLTFPEKHQPLMIGLAEIENREVVQDLLTTAPLNLGVYQIAHFNSPDARGIDVALCYDTTRFILVHEEAVAVNFDKKTQRKTRDILYVKGLLIDSVVLHVFVNHWPSRYGGKNQSEFKRIAAAKSLRLKVDSILAIDSQSNILIMGDFNDYPTDFSISTVLNAKSSVEANKNQLINLSYGNERKGKGTYSYKGEWGVLDQFIISPSLFHKENKLGVEKNSVFVINDKRFLYETNDGSFIPNRTYGRDYYGGFSDHLATYLYLIKTEKLNH